MQNVLNVNQCEEHSYSSKSGWFSLKLPKDWRVEEENECTSVYNSRNGVGVLQISTYLTSSVQNPESVLLEYLSSETVNIKKRKVAVDKINGQLVASYDYKKNRDYYKVWFIVRGCKLAFVTYNCDEQDAVTELAEIDEIIKSVTLTA